MTRRPRASALLCAALLVLASVCTVAARAAGTAERKTSAEARQAELRERIRALKNELAKTESRRGEARDALRESEAAISDANRKLRDLARKQQATRTRLASALDERGRTEAEIGAERGRLADLVRAQYLASRQRPWQLLLSGENPNEVGRNLVYLGYFARARQSALARLEQSTQRLAALADAERERAEELARIAAEQDRERQTLEREKQRRMVTLQKVSDQVRAQRKEVGALERDAARLNGLIARLSKMIADEEEKRAHARREAARRTAQQQAAARKAEEKRAGPSGAAGSAAVAASRPDTPMPQDQEPDDEPWVDNGIRFAATRGKLRLPVHGEIVGRYGQARAESKMNWKGVFIGAPQGTEVRAIAAGRVVFADWLRGFGNLLIVDHGDQYLSIYGGNEAMYKQAGQAVKSGEPIATVGATGGADRTGLYFEMRHRGEPFDPLGWVR